MLLVPYMWASMTFLPPMGLTTLDGGCLRQDRKGVVEEIHVGQICNGPSESPGASRQGIIL